MSDERKDKDQIEDSQPNSSEGSPAAAERQPLGVLLKKSLKEVTDPFVHLVKAPRALWGVNVSYVLEGLVYFGILTIIGKFLSENVGLSDLHAGWVLSLFTGGITLSMLFLGGTADRIGVRKALLISLALMTIGRVLLGASGTFFKQGLGASSPMFMVVALGLFIVVIGYGMYQPAAYAGVKQFTDEKTATIGYAMIYGLMNLGAFVSGIVSPPIRQGLGIESVFWVYAGLVALAFIAVLAILTPRVVKRDTLTELDDNKEEEEGDGKRPAKEKKQPLLTVPFIAYTVLALTGFGTVVGLTLTKEPSRAEYSVTEVSREFEAVQRYLPSAKDLTDPEGVTNRLVESGKKMERFAQGIVPPAHHADDVTVDPRVFDLLRVHAYHEANLLKGLERNSWVLTQETPRATETTLWLRNEIRFLGIYQMAAAESLVRPVDIEVVQSLQTRFKKPDEELIPIDEGRVKHIADVMGQPIGQVLDQIKFEIDELSSTLERSEDPAARLMLTYLRVDSAMLRDTVKLLGDPPTNATKQFLKDRIIAMSVFMLKGVAPLFEDTEDNEPVKGIEILAVRLASDRRFSDDMPSLISAGVQVPTLTRLMNWGLRYGIALLFGLFFVGALTRYILKRRKDHPFNNSKFVFFIFILIPVQTLFAHNWLTLPYYINRAFGGTFVGEQFEFFSNINPILIFVLSPVVAALTCRAKVYSMMIWGTFVMALPTFLLTIGPSPELLLLYILLMSVGEAMWQPRFLQWVAEIAPKGKTGAYMGIAQFPWFLTKVLTGVYSGYFLERYCPMVGPHSTSMMWLIYGFIALVTPFSLLAARRWANKDRAAV